MQWTDFKSCKLWINAIPELQEAFQASGLPLNKFIVQNKDLIDSTFVRYMRSKHPDSRARQAEQDEQALLDTELLLAATEDADGEN